MRTIAEIERATVAFGRTAAAAAENMTEEQTAEYFTDFLRHALTELAGLEFRRDRPLSFPGPLN